MNINKININQSESSYYIASDIYDVSAHNDGVTFESLSALLSDKNLSTLIPSEIRCGGMTIRFVQSSDNKYVQYRLMATSFSTTESDWQGVDEQPTVGSDNLVKSGGVANKLAELEDTVKSEENTNFVELHIDRDYNILESRDKRGKKTIYTDVEVVGNLSSPSINNKVEKEEGKTLVSEDIATSAHVASSGRYISITTDAKKEKILEAFDADGNKIIGGNLTVIGNILGYATGEFVEKKAYNTLGEAKSYTDERIAGIQINIPEDKLEELIQHLDAMKVHVWEDMTKDVQLRSSIAYYSTDFSPKTDSYADCFKTEVSIGDNYKISGLGGSNPRLWMIVNSSNEVVKKADANASAIDTIIEIDTDGFLICNFRASQPYSVSKYVGLKVVDIANKVESLYELSDEQNKEKDTIDNYHLIGHYDMAWYEGLGRYLASSKFGDMLLNNKIVDVKLSEDDVLYNSAGKTLIHNGFLYVYKYQNNITGDTIESKYIHLVKIDIAARQIVAQTKAFQGDESITFSVSDVLVVDRCLEGNIRVINGELRAVCTLLAKSGNAGLVERSFNLDNLSVVATNRCKLYNSEGVLEGDFPSHGGSATFNAGFALYNGYYYGALGTATKTIYKSNDFISWQRVFTYPLRTQGEMAIDINSKGICHLCVRKDDRDMTNRMYINKYDITKGWKLIDRAAIIGTKSMPSFFRANFTQYQPEGQLFLLSAGHVSNSDPQCNNASFGGVYWGDHNPGRNYYKITYINDIDLCDSQTLCDTNGIMFGPNTTVSVDSNNNLYGCLTGVNLIVSKFNLPSVTNQDCNNLLKKLLTL